MFEADEAGILSWSPKLVLGVASGNVLPFDFAIHPSISSKFRPLRISNSKRIKLYAKNELPDQNLILYNLQGKSANLRTLRDLFQHRFIIHVLLLRSTNDKTQFVIWLNDITKRKLKMEHGPMSLLEWTITSLGPLYLVLLPLSALVSFAIVLVLLFKGNGPMAGVCLVLVVFAPLLVGVFAGIQGMMNSYFTIATGGGTPDPNMIAASYSSALIAPMITMILSSPVFITAMIGTFCRSFSPASKNG